MVQLNGSSKGFRYKGITVFQFLYGTIKRPNVCDKQQLLPLFQFLYGTIKREAALEKLQSKAEFQFLYGTIKRLGAYVKR